MNTFGLTIVEDAAAMLLVRHLLGEVEYDVLAMLPDSYKHYECEAPAEWQPLVRLQMQACQDLNALIYNLPYWMRSLWARDEAYWKPLHGYVQDYDGQWVKPEHSILGLPEEACPICGNNRQLGPCDVPCQEEQARLA